MKLAVLASGRGSNLAAILEAIDAGRLEGSVAAVIADRDAPALERARARGLPAEQVPFRKADRAAWDADLAEAVAAHAPDVVVLAGFMRILGERFLKHFPKRILNVHPSLLPAFPGARAPQAAIDAGVRLSGCTVHLVDAGVDTGPILAQAAVPVLPGDDADRLHARIQAVEHRLLPAVLDAIGRGQLDLSTHQWTGPLGDADARAALLAPPGLAERAPA
ncbi:MAG TPA: phosphoribosylglycinamide formyltransferase [Polyangiaceae bacterium LLY-WYZ-15_(1-7)]|nr:phosphoribosylglycinamide formyltransferase [Myxococcales bacterium]MAT24990.1 phosphoribosylglycinamide formyltransferase [Sandaracinus sp.]HJL01343.1 phosphoribosylglycinamide formyltransferase [Polyangiaceae bacterium LLY-WYZ-15_(1-7)]MBJ73155.1 phosphoribosylglycinamide formyltransferase [Sandaracinus sp.]HJL10606.1 phosphoribosylglycinamide formyltransferase [Polyangiaceae bacterium LLY-WYZ-15_(1-7)]